MEQVKLFYTYTNSGDDVSNLQKKINKWYSENPNIIVVERQTTYSDEEFILTIFYKTNEGVSL